MDFWNFIGLLFWTYIVLSFLAILFALIVDVFRDEKLNGWLKAVWVIVLVFVPIIGAIIYVIARGRGMSERQLASAQEARSQTDTYIRSVAAVSPADEIARAKALLDAGSITRAEFDSLKARALDTSAKQQYA